MSRILEDAAQRMKDENEDFRVSDDFINAAEDYGNNGTPGDAEACFHQFGIFVGEYQSAQDDGWVKKAMMTMMKAIRALCT